MATIKFNRNTSKDTMLYIIPPMVYTDSTTLTAGMTLYDNTGTDTGYQVSKISNGNFELGQYSVSFVIDYMVTNYTLDGITYTTNTTLKLSEGTHDLNITGTFVSLRIQSTGVGSSVTVVDGMLNTGAYTGSLIISSGNITESTNNYLFGACPITLTFEGSMNVGGGSN